MIPMALGLGEGGEQNAPLGPRGHRRPGVRDRRDAVLRADRVRADPRSQAAPQTPRSRCSRACLSVTSSADRHDPRRLSRDAPLRADLAVAIAVVLGVWGIVSRITRAQRARARRRAASRAADGGHGRSRRRGRGGEDLVLPGTCPGLRRGADLRAHQRLLAKPGTRTSDAPVKKGQLLARDRNAGSRPAARPGAGGPRHGQANDALARTTDERWQGLLATESVSQQDAERRPAMRPPRRRRSTRRPRTSRG